MTLRKKKWNQKFKNLENRKNSDKSIHIIEIQQGLLIQFVENKTFK